MLKFRISVLAMAALVALPAAATEPALHIHGPKGCSYFDGLGGDGAAFHALDEDHILLDFETLKTVTLSCRFDAPFSLIGAPGKVERQDGTCEHIDGAVRNATFTLSYSDATNGVMEISGFDQPIPFIACPR